MTINWIQIVVSFFFGFVIDILTKGVRELLAPKILSSGKRIQAGTITKSRSEDVLHPFWYVPISVDANSLWVLLASGVDDVKANV